MTAPDGRSTFYALEGLPLSPEGQPEVELDALEEETSAPFLEAVLAAARELVERVRRAGEKFPVKEVEAVVYLTFDGVKTHYHLHVVRTDSGWSLEARPAAVREQLLGRDVASQVGIGALKQILGPAGEPLWKEYVEARHPGDDPLSENDIFGVADWLLEEGRIDHEQYHKIAAAVARSLSDRGV